MSVLKPTTLSGVATALLVSSEQKDLTTRRLQSVDVSFAGFAGDIHTGLTRESCSRVRLQYVVGTQIRNTRQISIVSSAELTNIASAMGVASIEPEQLGGNLVLDGIPQLSALPPSTRLIFSHGVSLVVDMENEPCRYPGEIIEKHQIPMKQKFASAARNLRGVTAWVEKEGTIQEGEKCLVHIPQVRAYPHAGLES